MDGCEIQKSHQFESWLISEDLLVFTVGNHQKPGFLKGGAKWILQPSTGWVFLNLLTQTSCFLFVSLCSHKGFQHFQKPRKEQKHFVQTPYDGGYVSVGNATGWQGASGHGVLSSQRNTAMPLTQKTQKRPWAKYPPTTSIWFWPQEKIKIILVMISF